MMQTHTGQDYTTTAGATTLRLAHQFQPCRTCRALFHVSRMHRHEDGTYLCRGCEGEHVVQQRK
jgi:hypothetical protein